jgi:glycine cleavage system H protein
MQVPDDLYYTNDHEWVRVEGDIATVGITEYAQTQLGDIVYVELPQVGDQVKANTPFGTVEAVKAVSDIMCPLSGQVTEVNDDLASAPEKIKESPYGDGWMVKIKMSSAGEVDALLPAADYKGIIAE